jgi:ABC-2 type transport system permease protein
MNTLTIARTALRRYLRDRTALFFVIALPVLVIVIVGATVGGFGKFNVALVDEDTGPLSTQLTAAFQHSPAIRMHRYGSEGAARTAARRGEVVVAVVIPSGFDTALRQGRDQQVTVLVDKTNSSQQAAESAIDAVVASQGARIQAARYASTQATGSLDNNLNLADHVAAETTPITIVTQFVDTTRRVLPEGFSYSAPTMLVLFVFINALAAGSGIIQSRKLGMYQRMSAAPVSARSIVAGETLCYLTLALLQSVLIVGVGALAFGVHWGNPLAAAALVGTWALVGTGAGVLSGTVFRTPEQASSIGPSIGIAFGMLGGCMWPLDIVPAAMRTFGHLFPHAWAVDAWITLLSRNGNLADITRPLVVLLGFASGLLVLATTRLRRSIAS